MTMKADNMFLPVHCEKAEDLLDEMTPHRGRLWERWQKYGIGPRDWIFRGVFDADLPLRPSAFREDVFAPFIPGQVTFTPRKPIEQRNYEDHVLTWFCTHADRT